MLKPYPVAKINSAELALSLYPDGGDDLVADLEHHYKNKMLIISHLTTYENRILGLDHMNEVCEKLDISFRSFPIEDASVPDMNAFVQFVEEIHSLSSKLDYILVHCWGGIGRSATTGIALLIRIGMTVEDAVELASQKRQYRVPQTSGQLSFLKDYFEVIRKRG